MCTIDTSVGRGVGLRVSGRFSPPSPHPPFGGSRGRTVGSGSSHGGGGRWWLAAGVGGVLEKEAGRFADVPWSQCLHVPLCRDNQLHRTP